MVLGYIGGTCFCCLFCCPLKGYQAIHARLILISLNFRSLLSFFRSRAAPRMKYFPFRAIPFGLHVYFLLFYCIIYNIYLPMRPIKLINNLATLQEVLSDSNFAVFSLQEPYTNPLASISCWHVHCEECWLRTLVSYYRNVYTPSTHLSRAHLLNTPTPYTSLSSMRFRPKFKG